MAPRRGGQGGAGAETSGTGARNYFEPPPLKRMSPWKQDGSDQCDVIAGGVDEGGVFRGVYVSSVHLMALMRTFQLSKVFMPCDVPTPVGYLGQSLNDGVPLIIVTRGCFGREMDYGPGPVRNTVQKTIWQTARDMRAEMPQILITCIDIPNNLDSSMLQACLEAPLNEYRELMYQDGTWYTPTVVNAAPLGKWMADNTRSKIPVEGKARQTAFNRKRFDWKDTTPFYENMWCIGWRPVLEARPAPEVARRTDLKFFPQAPKAEVKPVKLPPSAAEAAFKRALLRARDAADPKEMLVAADVYLKKAFIRETESLEEAAKAGEEAADLFKARGDAKEALEATTTKFKALTAMNRMDEALKVAEEAFASAQDARLKAQALKLVVTCNQTLGDLDKGIETAASGKAAVSRMGDDDATCDAQEILVNAYLAKADIEGAVEAAKEATSGKGKVEACGHALLALALMVKAAELEVPVEAKAAAREAAEAQKKAASLYKALNCAKESGEALKGAIESLLKALEYAEAATTAKELQELGRAEQSKSIEGSGSEMLARVLLESPSATEGGAEEMVSAARAAVALFEEGADTEGKASAMQVLADSLLMGEGGAEEACRVAKGAAEAYKAMERREDMCTALLTAAKARLQQGNLTSAFWAAKQVVSEGDGVSGYGEAVAICSRVSLRGEDAGKPVGVGSPVPVFTGDVAFI